VFYTPVVNSISQARSAGRQGLVVGDFAKVKAQDLSPASPSSVAQIVECSTKGVMLRVQRYLAVGTVVELDVAGEFSVWKVFCCVPTRNSFHVGIESAG
jgi:hypothetical protein